MEKSACFRTGRCFNPYLSHYRTAFAFSPILYPQPRRPSLRSACPIAWARLRAYHVPPDQHTLGLGPACSPVGVIVSARPIRNDASFPLTFWSKPFSNFGLFLNDDVYTAVHICCPYPASPRPLPPRCWQCQPHLTVWPTDNPRVLFPAASHRRITSPACAGGLCQLNDKFLLSEQLNQATSCRTRMNRWGEISDLQK